MASNTEMRRLILHAADLLGAAPGRERMVKMVPKLGYSDQESATRELVAMVAAMAMAEGTLRMVATCLADDEPEASAAPAPPRGPGGRFVKGGSS